MYVYAYPIFFKANFFLAELLVGLDQVATQLCERFADLTFMITHYY